MTRRALAGQAWLAVHAPPPRLLMLMANSAQFIGTVPTVEGRQPAITCFRMLHDRILNGPADPLEHTTVVSQQREVVRHTSTRGLPRLGGRNAFGQYEA